MKEGLTEIVSIVDRSGSMQSILDDAIGGFNTFLAAQQRQPGEAKLSLILFDHEYQIVHQAVDIQQVEPLNQDTYVPRGSTALLDAVGKTIDAVGERLAATPESERPSQVIVSILTDGYENASQTYSKPKVAEMIKHQTEKYSWAFEFQLPIWMHSQQQKNYLLHLTVWFNLKLQGKELEKLLSSNHSASQLCEVRIWMKFKL